MAHHSRNQRALVGILIAVLGCALALVGLASGIVGLTGSRHRDIVVRPITLTPSSESVDAGRVVLTETAGLSLWLRTADRRVENRRLAVSVALVDGAGSTHARVQREFRGGPSASSVEGLHYYRLGALDSLEPLAGRLRYRVTGKATGIAPITADAPALVIRRSRPFSVPLPEASLLLAGLGLVAVGLRRRRGATRRGGNM